MVGVAQRLERRVVAPKAVGSIPIAHPNKNSYVQFGFFNHSRLTVSPLPSKPTGIFLHPDRKNKKRPSVGKALVCFMSVLLLPHPSSAKTDQADQARAKKDQAARYGDG